MLSGEQCVVKTFLYVKISSENTNCSRSGNFRAKINSRENFRGSGINDKQEIRRTIGNPIIHQIILLRSTGQSHRKENGARPSREGRRVG